MKASGAAEIGAKIAGLVAVVGLSVWVDRLQGPELSYAAAIAAIGVFLIAGDLLAELVEHVGLPHLTGYLAAGLLLGPHGLAAVQAEAVDSLSLINALALALIALSAGGELNLGMLRQGARSLAWATLTQVAIAIPLIAAGFFVIRSGLPFLAGYSTLGVLAIALIWSVLAISRSPAATLGLIAQLEPDGPLTRYALALVIAFDIVVLLLFSVVLQVSQALLDPEAGFGLSSLRPVAMELIGSIAAGTTLGLLVTGYLKLIGKQLILFLLLMAYGMSEFAAWFNYDSLLMFVTAGFIVANVSQHGGERLLEAVSQGGRVTYVLFFAVAGAHLDVPMLASIWPVALGLALMRVGASWIAARAGSRLANDPPAVKRYGWMPLVSQAGVTIGMAVVVAETFSTTFGPSLQALVVAVVGINEAVGPVLFKFALDRTGETGRAAAQQAVPATGEDGAAAA